MLRKTILAAAAVTLCFAASAASTDASAARLFGGLKSYNVGHTLVGHNHRHVGTSGLGLRRTGGDTRCIYGNCGGFSPPRPNFVIRQCDFIKAPVPPPWCQNIPR
jgi:hypothetical protein